MNGYAGKILHVDLTAHEYSVIDTAKYEKWGGGHGIGSAIFWDLCKDKTIDGRDPRNVITIMTSPLTGTLVPSASGRVEVQGIGLQSYPIAWFTRSNFGGRFGGQLKAAGWDGIVVVGKSPKPVWMDILNDKVVFHDAKDLWGTDTWTAQQKIWGKLGVKRGVGDAWRQISDSAKDGRTTQKPAVLTIGPVGESGSSIGCLVHDAGNGSGQGGFGGVWGAKNLKAICVQGTGGIGVADSTGLLKARIAAKKDYTADDDKGPLNFASGFGQTVSPVLFWPVPEGGSRPQACQGCINGCRSRYASGMGNESSCLETSVYIGYDVAKHGKPTAATYQGVDLLQSYGANAFEVKQGLGYLRALLEMGVLGKGKAIDSSLDYSQLGETAFMDALLRAISDKTDIGADLQDGFVRAAKKWGRLDKDWATGALQFPYWGLPEHSYDSRAELEWGYGSLMGDRDINEHDFNRIFWENFLATAKGYKPALTAEQYVGLVVSKMKPLAPDTSMLDFSTGNMYSEAIAKLVSWQRHYSRFWKQGALYCDFKYPDFENLNRPDASGLTGSGEPDFWNLVTGQDITFEEGMALGRKVWNLDTAIWTLQGRTREMVHFAPYVHDTVMTQGEFGPVYVLPAKVNGTWEYANVTGRKIDRNGFEEWKTHFYSVEGWDVTTGWPTRTTLTELGLTNVADALESAGKLGKEQ